MSSNPQFPPVALMRPDTENLENFQYIPPRPINRGVGQLQRAPSFPSMPAARPSEAPRSQLINDPHHYVNAITGFTADLGGNAPALIIPRNDQRRNILGLRNTAALGGVNLFIDFGKAPTANSWLLIGPQQMFLFDTSVMQDDVWAVGSAAGWQVAWLYSTIPDN